MEITEIRIKLTSANNDKLRAFCSITLDNDFVIRDLKVIEGTKGPFVAMLSRKLTVRCPRCGGKNPHRANFCNDCGCKLPPERAAAEHGQRQKLHADIAHPINSRCREVIQARILEQYLAEVEKSKAPDYVPQDIDDFDDADLGSESVDYGAEGPAGVAAADDEGFPAQASGRPSQGPYLADRGAHRGRGRSEGRHRDFDRHRRREGVGGPRFGGSGGPGGRRGIQDGPGSASGRGPAPVERDLLRRESPGLVPRPSASEKRPLPAEADTEPEDNFGAGLFS